MSHIGIAYFIKSDIEKKQKEMYKDTIEGL